MLKHQINWPRYIKHVSLESYFSMPKENYGTFQNKAFSKVDYNTLTKEPIVWDQKLIGLMKEIVVSTMTEGQ